MESDREWGGIEMRYTVNPYSPASLKWPLELKLHVRGFLRLPVGRWECLFVLGEAVAIVGVVKMGLRVVKGFDLLKVRIFRYCGS